MTGVLERFPRLRVALAHGGGSFPFTIGRIDHGHRVRPDLCATVIEQSPSRYLDRLYVDSLVHDAKALRYLVDHLGAERQLDPDAAAGLALGAFGWLGL